MSVPPTAPDRPSRVRTTGRALGAMLFWLSPLEPTTAAREALRSDERVTVKDSRTEIDFVPAGAPRGGLVLYPGARIDPAAYAALARAVAERGYRVVVPRCPMNIALFATNAADRYVDDGMVWAVGGHSLGGVVASRYASVHHGVGGVVLWAAYAVSDLAHRTDLTVASVSGTRDLLTPPLHVAHHRRMLPAGTLFTEIEGAIHGYFGDYGEQPGDGEAAIDRDTAQRQVVAATVRLLDDITGRPGERS